MEIGDRLSHYRIVAKVGEGGMGVVYRAEDVRLGRQVALKVLAPHLAGNALARRRFEGEARAASSLDHPNICALYDVGETADGGLFLALAYCEGRTLRELLDSGGPIEPGRALTIAAQIADGLAEAHDKGIVHRDVKPANLMIRPDGLVKILDFGVARLERDAGITAPGDSLGSPAYMAPEQIENAHVGPSADLWAMGVVLFEMISGRRPFDGASLHAILRDILHSSPPKLHDLRPGVHPDVSRLVERALAKDPAARPASARQLAAELRAIESASAEATQAFTGVRSESNTGARSSFDWGATPAPAATVAPPGATASSAAASPSPPPSLAVLPFSDLSQGRDQDWFCEGLAEELITALSAVPGLRVASRASTAQFRDQDPRVTGEKLQVDTLLTGGVRKAGNRLRITTQLIKVADGSVLASSRYDHDLDDVFALQEEIARAAVEAVVARMDPSAAPRVRRPTENMEAYNLYLKGRYQWNRRTMPAFNAAITLFEQAIAQDPEFAAPYAGLADVYVQLGFYNTAPPRDLAERGKMLCRKALELDPELADARLTLATMEAAFYWNWAQAESELRGVLERSPDHVRARQALANYVLAPLGRLDLAVVEMKAALAIDPVSIPFNNSLGYLLHFARRSDEGLAQLRATLEMSPDSSFTRVLLSEVLVDLGRPDEGVEVLSADPAPPAEPRAALAMCFARAGRVEEARAILGELLRPRAGEYTSTFFPALVLLALGELEEAVDLLERAAEQRVPTMVWIGVRPMFDPLRGHSRFQRILERMRLPNLGPTTVTGTR